MNFPIPRLNNWMGPQMAVTPMVTKFTLGTTAKLTGTKTVDIKMMSLTKTQWEAAKKINLGSTKDGSVHEQGLVDKTQIIQ